jgi:hypothetical protein
VTGSGGEDDAELAEIARRLRALLHDAPRAEPPTQPAPPPSERRVAPGIAVLRLVGALVAPGLILIAVALLGGLNG